MITDRQAQGWRHPRRHVARSVERRTPAEMVNILAFDALIRTYGMDAAELTDLMLMLRGLCRGGGATERKARFLDDLARSLVDLANDTRP